MTGRRYFRRTLRAVSRPAPLQTASLLWAMAIACCAIGSLMLVAPHQFDKPVYAVINVRLSWWGAALVMAGASLFAVLSLAPGRAIRASAQFFAAGVLLCLGLSFLVANSLTGLITYALLGFATALAGTFSLKMGEVDTPTRDLLALTVGLFMALIGSTLLGLPSQLGGSTYDPIRGYLVWFGLAFLGSGVLLLAVNLYPFTAPGLDECGVT